MLINAQLVGDFTILSIMYVRDEEIERMMRFH